MTNYFNFIRELLFFFTVKIVKKQKIELILEYKKNDIKMNVKNSLYFK